MNQSSYIKAVLSGKPQLLDGTDILSAIKKERVLEPKQVTYNGFVADIQADTIHHGGADKALHQYPFEHYAFWKEKYPEKKIFFKEGGLGENLSTEGMTEENVMLGDVYKVGSCILQVSEIRQPCYKINYHLGLSDMSEQVQNNLKTGWYYRVLEEGVIEERNIFELLERPYPEWTLKRVLNLFYVDTLNKTELEKFIQIHTLSANQKKKIQNRLDTKEVEDWGSRLYGK